MAHRGYRDRVIDSLVLTLDVNDLDVQTAFWSGVFGYQVVGGGGPYRGLGTEAGGRAKFLLQLVPEPKSAKNRLHVDLHVADIDEHLARVVGLGATHVRTVDEYDLRWHVMLDPEGNEFCICPS
jgi:predicted enzyme related to lactoylglutathione lyase